ncbi:hypothetical protein N866_05190 [Actinotalea ferrariae CF5-4]|uniref:DUF2304 domain-containing protein n=1 Tax=Actinotalea ferrariae CF5-4 TaxID=948458 RepID=A0A021VUB0_9CELL|nr:DUF2304 domain-containing protein [Actinotalea ferrariae]EYR64774.1 hypothetical protein N866_05190 [Actinotalea ferrariae CF5-4]
MTGYVFATVACILVTAAVLGLLRTRRIREKYAGIWIALAAVNILFVVFPGLAVVLARLVGVATPVNLLFALAFIVLLVVCIHLSTELSRVEDQTRTLTEEIALVRLDLWELEDRLRPQPRPRDGGPADASLPSLPADRPVPAAPPRPVGDVGGTVRPPS